MTSAHQTFERRIVRPHIAQTMHDSLELKARATYGIFRGGAQEETTVALTHVTVVLTERPISTASPFLSRGIRSIDTGVGPHA